MTMNNLLLFVFLLTPTAALASPLSRQEEDQDYSQPLCFETRDELDQAIEDYLSEDDSRRQDVELVYGTPISNWCTTRITDFSHLFDGYAHFNESLQGWDVSNAISMDGMFYRAQDFNQDLSLWKTEKVQDMTGMFAHAEAFDQDLSAWDVRSVTSLRATFLGATSFRACKSLLQWDTKSLLDSEMMLLGTACEIQQDLLLQLGEGVFSQEEERP